MKVIVTYRIDSTTKKDEYTAKSVTAQIWNSGKGIVGLVNGSDDIGPVKDVLYKDVEKIMVRPSKKKKKK